MIEALTRPMIDLLEECGSGTVPEGHHADRPTAAGCDALRTVAAAVASAGSQALSAAGSAIGSGSGWTGQGWTGSAADAAAGVAADAARSAVQLADHGEHLDSVFQQGLAAMHRAAAEIGQVITSFVSVAAAMAPALATPAGPAALITLAIEHLGRATAIIGRLRAELTELTAQIARLTEPPPLPARPGGFGDAGTGLHAGLRVTEELVSAGTRMLSGATEAFGSAASGPGAAPLGSVGGTGEPGSGPPHADSGSAGAPAPGSGSDGPTPGAVTVTLPDGSTATAPNEAAAQAVRSALTQQGVPYQWGGTTPDSGLDCSGLTQWAYGEAGVEIPRLAGDQGVGTPISADSLQPGDLAVWDGHVAMIIGNGQMIEAGDPVAVSAVRTSNSGMAFQGFYRPTT